MSDNLLYTTNQAQSSKSNNNTARRKLTKTIDELSDNQIHILWEDLKNDKHWDEFWKNYYNKTRDYSIGNMITLYMDKTHPNQGDDRNIPGFRSSLKFYFEQPNYN